MAELEVTFEAGRWEVTSCGEQDHVVLDELLVDGWEPYGVDRAPGSVWARLYLRRWKPTA